MSIPTQQDDSSGRAPASLRRAMRCAALAGLFLLAPAPEASAQSLSALLSLEFEGESTGDEFGRAVANAGDINGDGYDDIIVGARYAGGAGEGAAYVYFGGAAADTLPDVIISGGAAGDHFGYAVCGVGNVDGDAYDDFLIGAPGAGAGKAYLFLGGEFSGAPLSLSAADAVAVISGEAAGDQFGFSLAGLADFNDDLVADLAVGAPEWSGNTGRVYVFSGAAGLTGSIAADTAAVTLTGEETGDYFGYSVAGAGNVNGDAFEDLVVGAYFGGSQGRAYVFLGQTSPPASIAAGSADAILTGTARFGWSVCGAGDLDGDSFDDVAVGALLSDAAYVFRGGAGLAGAISASNADMILNGEVTGDRFGVLVASAQDADGDGLDDLIVGATRNDAGGIDAGRAYVFLGENPLPASRAAAAADVILTGGTAGELFGWFGAAVPDFSPAAQRAIVLGSPGYDSSRGRAGLYVFTPDAPPAAPTLVAEPAFTAGTENMLEWSDESASGAAEYQVEAATDASFTAGAVQSGWLAGLTHTFVGLVDGQTYFYRVKARSATLLESDWSPSESSTQDDSPPSSAAGPLAGYQTSWTFDVPWSASDAGSGVATVELFYQIGGGGYLSYGSFAASPIAFAATTDGVYDFYTLGTDALGNLEPPPGGPDATTVVDTDAFNLSFLLSPPDGQIGCDDTLQVDLSIDATVTDLRGYSFLLGYNEAVFTPVSVAVGPQAAAAPCDTFFVWNNPGAGDGTIDVDVGLLGCSLDGPGSILTMRFIGASDGTGQISVVSGILRDSANQSIPFTIAPAAVGFSCSQLAPVITPPGDQSSEELDEVSLQIEASDPEMDALTFSASGLPPDLTIDTPTGLITGTVACGTAAGSPYAVTVIADDGHAGADTVFFTWTVTAVPPEAITDLLAEQVRSGNDGDGTTGIMVSWTAMSGGDSVRVYRKGFGAYPEYDDAGGGVPLVPATPADADTTGWELTEVGGSGQIDQPASRDFWYYVAFVVDGCGRSSLASNLTSGTLGYHLGDVAGGPLGLGDNLVDVTDVSLLGAGYGLSAADSGWAPALDVGPTADMSPDAIPLTDDQIEFEDMMLFAINFDAVSKTLPPVKVALNRLVLVLPTGPELEGLLPVQVWLEGDGTLQGVSVLLAWNPVAVQPTGFVPGELMAQQGGPYLLLSSRPGNVDAALIGLRPTGITGTGRLATLDFYRLAPGDPGFDFDLVRARNGRNEPVIVPMEIITDLVVGPEMPMVSRLYPNYPDPFNPQTTIAFDLAREGAVKLVVYGMDGRLVEVLVDQNLPAGTHRYTWQGRDQRGRSLPSGLYFARFATDGQTQTERMMLVR
jgi:hypothetical protein